MVKLHAWYDSVIASGIRHDPRGEETVKKELRRLAKEYEALSAEEKKWFDTERLANPYSDSRILHGSGQEDIAIALIGIDIDVGEVLLADRLIAHGKKIDGIISHHPEGKALAALYQVMPMQADIAYLSGVPITIAEGLLNKRMGEVERRLLPANHTKTVDAARLLNIPLLCIHTPADNHVTTYLRKKVADAGPEYVGDVMNILYDIPEYALARRNNAGPKIINGAKTSRTGKIIVDMTGGTEGAKEIFASLAQAGVGTVIGMHFSEEHIKKAKDAHVNIIIAGHISSDTLGLNLLLDDVERQQNQSIEFVCCSGFTRIVRK